MSGIAACLHNPIALPRRRLSAARGPRGWELGHAGNGLERGTLGQSGVTLPRPPVASPVSQPCRRRVVGCVGLRQFSQRRLGPGNWKSEKLTARSPVQIARNPDFQDFRYSPAW
jgi:hypothetical protein